MSKATITADMLTAHGTLIQTLYGLLYPDGLTRAELEKLAPEHGWIRHILAELDKEG